MTLQLVRFGWSRRRAVMEIAGSRVFPEHVLSGEEGPKSLVFKSLYQVELSASNACFRLASPFPRHSRHRQRLAYPMPVESQP